MDELTKKALNVLRDTSELYGLTRSVPTLIFCLGDLNRIISRWKMEDIPKEVITGLKTNRLIIIDRIAELMEEERCG